MHKQNLLVLIFYAINKSEYNISSFELVDKLLTQISLVKFIVNKALFGIEQSLSSKQVCTQKLTLNSLEIIEVIKSQSFFNFKLSET